MKSSEDLTKSWHLSGVHPRSVDGNPTPRNAKEKWLKGTFINAIKWAILVIKNPAISSYSSLQITGALVMNDFDIQHQGLHSQINGLSNLA